MDKCCICDGELNNSIVKTHKDELDDLLTSYKTTSEYMSDDEVKNFKSTKFHSVLDAGTKREIDINYLEEKHKVNHPEWKTSLQCFPKSLDYIDEGKYQWAKEEKDWIDANRRDHKDYKRRVGYYKDVIGKDLGEDLVQKTLYQVFKDVPSALVAGFDMEPSLKNYKNKFPDVQTEIIKGNISGENDIMLCYASSDRLCVIFVQIKTLDKKSTRTDSKYKEQIQQRLKKALQQTVKDVKCFLVMFPELRSEDLSKVELKTLVALPTTKKDEFVCSECDEFILFRDDFNPECNTEDESKTIDLPSQILKDVKDIQKKNSSAFMTMSHKLLISSSDPADINPTFLSLLHKISSRYIGLASIIAPLMMPVSNPADKNFDKMERHLYLSPDQIEAIKSKNCVITGFYGTGKSVALELAAKEVLTEMVVVDGKKRFRYENPKVIFIVWDNADELYNSLNRKFDNLIEKTVDDYGQKRIQSNVDVIDRDQLLEKYAIGRSKLFEGIIWKRCSLILTPDGLIEICKKLKLNPSLSEYSHLFVMVDEASKLNSTLLSEYTKVLLDNINIMVALQPVCQVFKITTEFDRMMTEIFLNSYDQQTIKRTELKLIHLKRSYRCTKAIFKFIQTVLGKECGMDHQYKPPEDGSTVEGEKPELYFWDCNCSSPCIDSSSGCSSKISQKFDNIVKKHRNKIVTVLHNLFDVGDNIPYHEMIPKSDKLIKIFDRMDVVRGVEYPVLIVVLHTQGYINPQLVEFLTRVSTQLYVFLILPSSQKPVIAGIFGNIFKAIDQGLAILPDDDDKRTLLKYRPYMYENLPNFE